jgi:dihydroxyacetone kinase
VRSILVAERARRRRNSGVQFAPGVEKSTWSTGRREVAGTLIVEKIVGAVAEQGASLSQTQDTRRTG